ncbi:MAG: PAS domain-containing sensor histidine kinase [Burkholderiales bacterium]|nr:MAG: PAS domain-containing sensor histidine kinase [Burkholderiales bacterium]
MAQESPSQFAPSWFSVFEGQSSHGREQRQRALDRLWRTFMRARAFIATVLLALQVYLLISATAGPDWLVLVCALHVTATIAALLWLRPAQHSGLMQPQWLLTIGVDIVVFALLQFFQTGGFNYMPLFALPVLLAAILGPLTLGLAAAAAVTLYLLGEAVLSAPLVSDINTARLLQAGLTAIGFFLVAVLANQLALRLAREEAVAKSSQDAARAQAQVNELIIESLSEGVMVVDPHGVVRNANPAAQTMLMGSTYPHSTRLLLSARDNWADLAQLVQETYMLGQPMESEVHIDVDELTTHRLFARTRLTSQSGRHGGLCVLFLEDLRELEAQVRTEKLASMGRMSAAVAHEIRNPLSAITQANALLDEEVQSAGHKRLTQMIGQNAQRLSRIVDDILNVARAQPSQIEDNLPPIPLDDHIRLITREWVRQNQAKGKIGVHVHAPGAQVRFDLEHLRRLMINLLDNALRHASGQPSSIRVITQPSGGERIRLSVWSDGAPLEAGVLRHLFEPFFSSESRSSGLGLYICRELCERYGAQIAYQRTVLDQREGNEFFVHMPASGLVQRQQGLSRSTPPGDSVPALSRPPGASRLGGQPPSTR